jgi:hypothetical protein
VGKRVREAFGVAPKAEAAGAIEAFLLSLAECEAARLAGRMEEHFSLGVAVLESLSSWYVDSLLNCVRCHLLSDFVSWIGSRPVAVNHWQSPLRQARL